MKALTTNPKCWILENLQEAFYSPKLPQASKQPGAQSGKQIKMEVKCLVKVSGWLLLTLRGRTPACGWRWRFDTWCGCVAARNQPAMETCSGCWHCSTAAWQAEGWTTSWRDVQSWWMEEKRGRGVLLGLRGFVSTNHLLSVFSNSAIVNKSNLTTARWWTSFSLGLEDSPGMPWEEREVWLEEKKATNQCFPFKVQCIFMNLATI